jgi:hypothetical protein
MGELGAMFNPGMRHELEERRSKAARREEEGNARDGDLHIDLASGIAVINVPSDDEDDGETSSTDQGASTSDAAEQAGNADTRPDSTVVAPTADPGKAALRPRGKRGMTSSSR